MNDWTRTIKEKTYRKSIKQLKASVGKNCFKTRYLLVDHIPNKYVIFNDNDSL